MLDSAQPAEGGPLPDAPLASDSDSGSGSGDGDAGLCAAGSNSVVLAFSEYPQLTKPWGSAQAIAPGFADPICGQPNIIVVAGPTAASLVALSGSCTIACCVLVFDGTQLVCPCHDATFDLGGQCTSGPAPALTMLAVCADDEGVTVTW